jgi:hypothetical protein
MLSANGCELLASMAETASRCEWVSCTARKFRVYAPLLQVLPAEAQGRISILASRQDTTVPDIFAKSLKRRCSCQQR